MNILMTTAPAAAPADERTLYDVLVDMRSMRDSLVTDEPYYSDAAFRRLEAEGRAIALHNERVAWAQLDDNIITYDQWRTIVGAIDAALEQIDDHAAFDAAYRADVAEGLA